MIITDCLSPEARRARFDRICAKMLASEHEKGLAGVGTLQEKRLHAAIKHYLTEDEDDHEVGILNTRYVADVKVGSDVFEVQTGNFAPMRAKIDHYLNNTDFTVTVVHPIAVNRLVSKIDPATGKVWGRRKSPRHGKLCDLLAQMYPLIPYLGNPRLQFRVLLLDVQDFRLSSGKRSGERYERIPSHLLDDIEFFVPQDFLRFLPDTLPETFTVRMFSEKSGIRGLSAYSAVRVLAALGLIEPAAPIGRAMAFQRK